MSVKTKAKPLSQLRREEKQRKMIKKSKKLAAQQVTHNTTSHPKKGDLMGSVQQLQNRINKGQINQPNKKLSFEERFVKEITELDETLSDIITNIDNFSGIRSRLNWDMAKQALVEEQAKPIEDLIVFVETENAKLRESFVTELNKIDEELQALKAEPTPEGLDQFVVRANSFAFNHFGVWNETIVTPFCDIQDLIDNLSEGETK